MVEKADSGCDRRAAFAVEVDHDLDGGFLGSPLDGRLAHSCSPRREAAFYQGFGRAANLLVTHLHCRGANPKSCRKRRPSSACNSLNPARPGFSSVVVAALPRMGCGARPP